MFSIHVPNHACGTDDTAGNDCAAGGAATRIRESSATSIARVSERIRELRVRAGCARLAVSRPDIMSSTKRRVLASPDVVAAVGDNEMVARDAARRVAAPQR